MPPESMISNPRQPGRPGLTFEDYEKAYHELSGTDGTPPSQRQLRKYLGTGSNTTLAGYRRRIAEERQEDEQPPEPGSLDAELLATVHRLAKQISLDEAQVADDRVDEIQKDADDRIRVAEATMAKRLEDTALLEHRAKSAEADLELQKKKLEEKSDAFDNLKGTYQDLKEAHAVQSQALKDASRQIGSLTREVGSHSEKLEEAQKSSEIARKDAEAKLSEQRNLENQIQKEHVALKGKYSSLSDRIEERNTLIETLNVQQHEIQKRLDREIASRETCLERNNDLQLEHNSVRNQLSDISAELRAEKKMRELEAATLKSVIADKDKHIVELQASLKHLSTKI